MSYSADIPFASNGDPTDMCAFIESRVAQSNVAGAEGGRVECFPPADSACGNGLLEAGEICDDGNVRGGDGCSEECDVECGWVCSQPDGLYSVESSCARHCGDGHVQLDFGEQCDDDVR